jgi:serine protease inhibitor ecotin
MKMTLSLMLKLSSLKMRQTYGCLEEYLRLKKEEDEETLSVVMMSSKFVDTQCSQTYFSAEL